MAKQKVMFYTLDNHVIVTDIDLSGYTEAQKRDELKRMQDYFLQYKYNDICLNFNDRNSKPTEQKKILSLMDGANTSFVNVYVKGFDYTKNRSAYKNSVEANNFPSNVKKPNTLHFDYSFDDFTVPEFVKNLGFKIEPKEIFTNVDIDAPDFDEKFRQQKTFMQVFTANRRILVHRQHYKFAPADYVRLRRMITDYEALTPKPDIKHYCSNIRNPREHKLFRIYAQEVSHINKMKTFLHHEFHHIKNRMVFEAMMCKPDFKRLSAENTYRMEVENERSAYLSQTVEAINIYLQKGNSDDYSMFDSFSEFLVDKIKTMSPEQKVEFLTDMDKVVNLSIDRFESTRREYYDENQFINSTKANLSVQPLDVPEDLSGEQYKLIRSAYYSVAVYNPATGRREIRNLSKYIRPEKEVRINAEEKAQIIKPAKEELRQKKNKFVKDSHALGVNPALLDEARAFMLKSIRSPRIISEVQTLNVADLAEGKPQIDEHHSEYKSPTQPSAPEPVADDKADWSDELQKYWKSFDGYKEISKNNVEYSFSIKNQKVSYTSKGSVRLDSSCKYEMYKRLVEEPSSAKKAVRFEDSLSKEQALMLYVACVNGGRRMRGAIPSDLSAIDSITSIPKAELDKFKAKISPSSSLVGSASVVRPALRSHGR